MTRCSLIIIIATIIVLMTLFSAASGHKRKTKKVEKNVKLEGRYTRDIHEYEAVIPRKVQPDGTFHTFAIPHFYERRYSGVRRRRYANESDVDDADDRVHYALTFGGTTHHIELVPNHDFMSPGLVVESRRPRELKESKLRRVRRSQCHYTGWVRGHVGSRAALSVCDGLVGNIRTSNGHFYIEPVKGKSPKDDGRHLHVVYRNDQEAASKRAKIRNCKAEGWENAWADRFRNELREGNLLQSVEASKRSVSKQRFLEVMIVADRQFISHHKATDVETYILTIMNMVSDFYRDASIGNPMEFVLVRIVYLEKEKEEFDLMISPNAEDTLFSFCDWQHKVNPSIESPSHHDIAVLLTRYDLCSDNVTNCDLVGLAHVGAACDPPRSCCINEDLGLTLAMTVTHEVGHVLGCSHDEPEISGCESQDEDKSYFVMSPFVEFHTTRWSTCSRKYVTEFLDNGLGECLLDEPQDQNFDLPEMPAGAMYDASFQCSLIFGPNVTEPCKTGTDTYCEILWCLTKPDGCSSQGDPPADGTSCGTNMWCYDQRCVEIGERPGAVDGGWGEYGAWSECSRTCGAGVRFQERACDNPTPANRGRYCLGKRKNYETCNTTPCGEGAIPFREQQCTEFNTKRTHVDLHTWKPLKPKEKHNPCALICGNEEGWYSTLKPRVKDGTKCRFGTRDLCISGKCTKIGCDWQVESDAIDDRCGICRGDGTQCSLTESIFNQTNGQGYVEVVTIPKGARHIKVEELKPVENSLAVSAASDDKKFYLNGDNMEVGDGEYRFGNAIGIYSHPEKEREELEIAGPTSEDLIIYLRFYGNDNPGVWYKYITPGANTSYTPKYDWEFLDWGDCSVRCGPGSQISEASCVEAQTGKVGITFCQEAPKPNPKSRVCNIYPCYTRWKTGSWSWCEGKDGKGLQHRKVVCVRLSPHADEPDIEVESGDCTGTKPKHSQECEVIPIPNSKSNLAVSWGVDDYVEEAELVDQATKSLKRSKYDCGADKKDNATSHVSDVDKKKENTCEKAEKPKKEEPCVTAKTEKDNPGKCDKDITNKADKDNHGKNEKDNPGKCDKDITGKADKDNHGKNEKDNSSKCGKDNHGKSEKDNLGKCDKDTHVKSEKDNPGTSAKDNFSKCSKDSFGKGDKDNLGKSQKDNHEKCEKDHHEKSEKDNHDKCEKDNHDKCEKDNHEKCEKDNHEKSEKDNCGKSGKDNTLNAEYENSVVDKAGPDALTILEAPIVKPKPKNSSGNNTSCPDGTPGQDGAEVAKSLSDEAVEELGDKMPEITLDLKNEIVLKGEKAAKVLKEASELTDKANCRKTKAQG